MFLTFLVTLIIVVNHILASVSTAAHSPYPLLISLMAKHAKKMNTIIKLKVYELIANLSCNHKIGYSC
jgi:hypothetical protein